MKKFLVLAVLFLMVVSFSGCGSTSSGGAVVSLVGLWNFTQQQTQPAIATYTGIMNVTSASSSSFQGTVTFNSPQVLGPLTFTGILSGTTGTITFNYGATETWAVTFSGNTMNGTWSTTAGLSGTITGGK